MTASLDVLASAANQMRESAMGQGSSDDQEGSSQSLAPSSTIAGTHTQYPTVGGNGRPCLAIPPVSTAAGPSKVSPQLNAAGGPMGITAPFAFPVKAGNVMRPQPGVTFPRATLLPGQAPPGFVPGFIRNGPKGCGAGAVGGASTPGYRLLGRDLVKGEDTRADGPADMGSLGVGMAGASQQVHHSMEGRGEKATAQPPHPPPCIYVLPGGGPAPSSSCEGKESTSEKITSPRRPMSPVANGAINLVLGAPQPPLPTSAAGRAIPPPSLTSHVSVLPHRGVPQVVPTVPVMVMPPVKQVRYHPYDSSQASRRCSCVRGHCDSRKCKCFREGRACVGCDCMACKNTGHT